ncbi:MAG: hypothetical protein AYP45_14765 [Candidatus Brocadia carolinensis]|uniref:Uncharacterized protein n=1 Tax=Candidatus Brocadia carolinensis TaxID=1004156 RepID=A0A1V4AQQ2_9BACT|nr:MAG: hypothetical protein AYP45_14765 [Candidatus Brocadia caroliniensis]
MKHTDAPIVKRRVLEDFLPSPDQLIVKEENVKLTIFLKKEIGGFFNKKTMDQPSHQKMTQQTADWYKPHYQHHI